MGELHRAVDARQARERARTQAEYDELGPPTIAMEPVRSSTGTIHTNQAGRPRGIGTGEYAGIITYGGAGHYAFSCDCEPEVVRELAGKPGECPDIDNHLAFCKLQTHCFGCLLPLIPDDGVDCYDRKWHDSCLAEEEAKMREEVLR